MSTTRSKDRSSLCSFPFADGRQCAVSSRACLAQSGAARDLLFAVVVAGLQTRQRDGREHPVSSRVQRSQIPALSEGTCFSPCSHAFHKPLLARPPARTSPITSPAALCPPAISAPPSDAFSPLSPKVKSNPKPPPPSPISAKPSSKSCPSPRTNTSTPTTPIPGAKPSAPLTNSLPITCRLIPHRRLQNRLQPLLPRRHQTHLPPPNRTQIPSQQLGPPPFRRCSGGPQTGTAMA